MRTIQIDNVELKLWVAKEGVAVKYSDRVRYYELDGWVTIPSDFELETGLIWEDEHETVLLEVVRGK